MATSSSRDMLSIPRLNPAATAENPPSLTSDKKTSWWSASRSLLRRISRTMLCCLAQFGHSVSCSPKHLEADGQNGVGWASGSHSPLMVAVVTHKVYTRKVELAAAG